MIAFLIPIVFAAHLAFPTRAGMQNARGGAVCTDPAMPLIEIARDYRFPEPGTGREREAYVLAKRYFTRPTPRAYHNILSEYKWIDGMSREDLHIATILGVLYASGPDVNLPTATGYRHNAIAANALADDAGARALNAVISKDPTQWIAAVALTRIALVSPEEERMLQATSAVRRALQVDTSNTALQLAWHDLLVAQERAPEALAFSRRFPNTCAAVQHAHAESLLLTGDTAAGVRLYLETLRQARPDELHRFYDDMRVAASRRQLRDYEKTPREKRGAWIEKFWNYAATSYARSVEARVSEQIIRAAYADVHFRKFESAVSSDRPNWVSDTAHIVPWDSRGVTYIRHGAPLHRFKVMNQCLESYEAWVYSAEESPWVVWFEHECISPEAGARNFDWRPIYAPPMCGRPFLTRPVPTFETAKAKLESHPEEIDRRDIYTLLMEYDPRYKSLLHECAKVAIGDPTPKAIALHGKLEREGITLFNRLQWRESAAPQLAKRAQMTVAAYEFQDAQRRPEVAAFSWIPLSDLGDNDSAAESMRFSYIVADTLLRASRVDAVSVVPPHGGERGALLRNTATLTDVGFGMWNMRVIAIDPADTTRGAIRSVPLNVRGAGAAFDMSDIVLAVPDVRGALRRGTFAVEPVPGHVMDVGRAFRVFFEVYGVANGETVSTTVSVTRLDQSALQELRNLFRDKVATRTITFPRNAELDSRGVLVQDVLLSGDLLPGDYKVDVTIQLPNGKSVTRHTGLLINR